jgi:prepilin-type N-terminal cleavage/methylation domain-containing protein
MSLRGLVKKVVFSGRDRRGFTLIEVLVALSVGSIIVAGASQVLQQMFYLVPKAENSMLAMRQVQFAGHWIDRDAIMAQIITPSDNVSPPPSHNLSTENLTMSHVEWNPSDNTTIVKTVTYSLANQKLSRREVVTDEKTGATKSGGGVYQVADSITSLTYTVLRVTGSGMILTDNITAQVWGASETRTYTTRPRSF